MYRGLNNLRRTKYKNPPACMLWCCWDWFQVAREIVVFWDGMQPSNDGTRMTSVFLASWTEIAMAVDWILLEPFDGRLWDVEPSALDDEFVFVIMFPKPPFAGAVTEKSIPSLTTSFISTLQPPSAVSAYEMNVERNARVIVRRSPKFFLSRWFAHNIVVLTHIWPSAQISYQDESP